MDVITGLSKEDVQQHHQNTESKKDRQQKPLPRPVLHGPVIHGVPAVRSNSLSPYAHAAVETSQKLPVELDALAKKQWVEPSYYAMIYAGLGDKDRAFVELEKAYGARSWYMGLYPSTPSWIASARTSLRKVFGRCRPQPLELDTPPIFKC